MKHELNNLLRACKQKKKKHAHAYMTTTTTTTERERQTDRERVILYFEPSQPLGIIPGLKETFGRTNKAEIRPEEQRKTNKQQSCRENLWNEIQFKGTY